MYELCVEIAANYIRKYARARRLDLDVAELAHDSAVYVIEKYLRKPEFRVGRISAYIHYGCLKALFRDKEWEQGKASYEDCRNDEAAYAAWETPGFPGDGEPERGPRATWKQGLLFKEQGDG